MAWTTPLTGVSGTQVNVANWNTYLTDNLKWLHNPPGVRISNATSVSTVSTATETLIDWDGCTEEVDTDTMYAGSGDILTTTTVGLYVCSFFVTMSSSGYDSTARILKNTTTEVLTTGWRQIQSAASLDDNKGIGASGIVLAAAADTFGVYLTHDGGADRSVGGTASSHFAMTWVGNAS
jgi:hypothetical protein